MRFIEVSAKSHYEAGLEIGKQVGDLIREYAEILKPKETSWDELEERAMPYLNETEKTFPPYIEEMRGLAGGSQMSFDRLWTTNCIDEILEDKKEKCTSFFVRNDESYIVGHSEDWTPGAEKFLYLQKRTINGITVFEECYATTLGGFGASVNSFGLVQAINSLPHTDHQIGIPKKIIGRWLSEAPSFELIRQELPKIKRSSGVCHNFVQDGKLMNIESTAKEYDFFETEASYFHTNHYTRDLAKFESDLLMGSAPRSRLRYELASRLISRTQNTADMQNTLSFTSEEASICEHDTIGSMIFDLNQKVALVALDRPSPQTRWQKFDLDFINQKPI